MNIIKAFICIILMSAGVGEVMAQGTPVQQNTGHYQVENNRNLQPILPGMPDDTLSSFLAAYGKDSLLTLLDYRISLAKSYLNTYSGFISDPITTLRVTLLDKHFKWGLDTSRFTVKTSHGHYTKLYGEFAGDYQPVLQHLQTMKGKEKELYTQFIQGLSQPYARIGFALFSNLFDIPGTALDTLYSFSIRQKLPEQLESYWIFTEFKRNNPGKSAIAGAYQQKLYDTLNAVMGLDRLIQFYNASSDSTRLYLRFNESLRLLAYSLYANQAGLETENSRNLIYLLHLQQGNGGWRDQPAAEINYYSSIYATWALCELRQLLKNQ